MRSRGSTAKRLGHHHADGGFAYDFTTLPDSDSLPAGLTDGHIQNPNRQDPLCIRSGGVGLYSLNSADYPNFGSGSGNRGLAWRDTRTLSSGVYSRALTSAQGPLIHCNPSSTELGLGSWFNYFFGYWEIGTIGRNPDDWRYRDVVWTAQPTADVGLGDYNNPKNLTMELRSDGTKVALYVDGVWTAGPVPIPPALLGATRHGIQIDNNVTQVPFVSSIECGPFNGTLADYLTPAVEAIGTINKPSGTARTITLDYPSSPIAGEMLIAVIGFTGNGTFAGPDGTWSVSHNGNSTQKIAILGHRATGSESGSVLFTKTGGSNGLNCGVILRISHVHTRVPYASTALINTTSSTTINGPASTILGMHHFGLWVAVTPADLTITRPTDWTTVATTPSGGAAITLKVAGFNWDTIRVGQPPFGQTGILTNTINGTASSATTSAVYSLNINGMPGT